MKDTHEKIEKIYHQMMMRRSGEERLMMCFSMLETAKEIIKSNLEDKTHWREQVFLRLYGNDFDDNTKKKILAAIRKFQENNKTPEEF